MICRSRNELALATVPEPAPLLIVAIGVGMFIARRRGHPTGAAGEGLCTPGKVFVMPQLWEEGPGFLAQSFFL